MYLHKRQTPLLSQSAWLPMARLPGGESNGQQKMCFGRVQVISQNTHMYTHMYTRGYQHIKCTHTAQTYPLTCKHTPNTLALALSLSHTHKHTQSLTHSLTQTHTQSVCCKYNYNRLYNSMVTTVTGKGHCFRPYKSWHMQPQPFLSQVIHSPPKARTNHYSAIL